MSYILENIRNFAGIFWVIVKIQDFTCYGFVDI